MLRNKVGDFRVNDLAPFTTGKDPVMPTLWCGELLLAGFRDGRTQFLRCMGLAQAGNVIALTFNGKQRYSLDILWLDQLAFYFPRAQRQAVFLEHGLDRFEIVLGRHVQYGVVLIVKLAMFFRRFVVAFAQVHVEVPMTLRVATRIHRDEAGMLQEARINLAPKADSWPGHCV